MKVWAGILAAGQGRRLGGRPKALLELRGVTFLEMIAESARAAGVSGVAAVVGYHAGEVRPLAAACCDIVVDNPKPELGMASSARILAQAIPDDVPLLLWPVDVPHVRPSTVETIVGAGARCASRIVIPVCTARGHPPLLPASVVAALRTMDDEARLDLFIETVGGDPLLIEVDDPAVEQDVDTAEDLRWLEEQGAGGGKF